MFQIRLNRVNRKYFSVKTLISTYLKSFLNCITSQTCSVFPPDSERLMKVWGYVEVDSSNILRKLALF